MTTVVLLAEIATLGLFILFASLVRQFHQDDEGSGPAHPDPVGDVFISTVRWGMIVGYATFFALSAYWIGSGGFYGQ
ncbi:hypothetical protein W911_08165 [Hyphomicrobium nitrativorans NL23]|uniref:Uncharacterized protein n=1 Tax=Hyphomicrobium nitrativorans NL23 TaxID=1029756 RepID=V5SGV4_9HYPH|nr:hypothetical protein [Hyphomicrobium nitrativorans]AHB50106.1 hypothetical protein W911_08165 [Hyphomicrobium nitrativorans NL23]